MNTPRCPETPSISESSWLTWPSCVSIVPRRPAIASISSMKMIEGRFSRARSKRRRMLPSDSPTHFEITSAPEMG
jgi:hypothetical protein